VPEDEYLTILDLIAERRAADVFSSVGRLSELGVDLGSFVTGLADMLRAQLAVTLGAPSVDVSERARSALEERRGRLSTADLLRMLAALGEMEPRFRKSAQQQLLLEMLLVRFALLDRSVMIEDVLRGLGGEGGGAGASTGQATPRAADPPPRSDRIASPAAGASTRADARVADRPAPSPLPRVSGPLDLNRVVEDWDDVVARVRGAGRNVIASMLERAVPVAVTAKGVVTLQVDDEAAEQGIESSKADVLAAVRARFPGVERLVIRRSEMSASPTGARRMSEETVRDERMASLRKRDPVLGAAIDALDLELLD
jgi:DNA polymerase-3 subunit gamma/tau